MPKIALIVVALSLVAGSTPSAPPPPTFLGVVDKDGLLTPIAVYDGSAWWNRWPWAAESEEIRNLPIPSSLGTIPEDWLPPGVKFSVNWRAYRASGKLVPFRAVRPARRGEYNLMDTIVIQTTYRSVADEGDVVAISGPGALARTVEPTRRVHDAVLRQLLPRIAALEAAEIARWKKEAIAGGAKNDFVFTEVDQVTDGSDTRIVPAPPLDPMRAYGLTKVAGPIEGRTYYELHGEKMFRMRPGDDCLMGFSTNGLVVVGPRGNVVSEKLGSWAYGEFCGDARETNSILAMVTIGPRLWRIERTGLEDGYDYGLADPFTGEPILLQGGWDLREKRQMPNPNRVRHSAFAIRH